MINIKDKKDCSGCSACYNICPVNAIEFIPDSKGFSYPKVNIEKCISCNLCEKVCPIINKNNIYNKPKAYAVINKDDEIRKYSSSGGIFSLLATVILEQGGVIFGARFDENFNVIHDYVENTKDLQVFRGSKYVQSNINITFKKAKEFLNNGRLVYFSGTPCQIEGLKTFLQKDYPNLYTQDLICHGVPSPKVWRKYLEFRRRKDSNKPIEINFRNKISSWRRYNITFKYKNANYMGTTSTDMYMQAFLKNICLRDSCHACNFKKLNRFSDITLADFWGIDNVEPSLNDDKGTSLVIINSKKGDTLFETIKKYTIYKEVNLIDAIQKNTAIHTSVEENTNREDFFKELDSLEFDKLIEKYLTN